MKPIEIIVIVISIVIVLAVTAGSIIRKRINKKTGCTGGCCSCPYSRQCNISDKKKK